MKPVGQNTARTLYLTLLVGNMDPDGELPSIAATDKHALLDDLMLYFRCGEKNINLDFTPTRSGFRVIGFQQLDVGDLSHWCSRQGIAYTIKNTKRGSEYVMEIYLSDMAVSTQNMVLSRVSDSDAQQIKQMYPNEAAQIMQLSAPFFSDSNSGCRGDQPEINSYGTEIGIIVPNAVLTQPVVDEVLRPNSNLRIIAMKDKISIFLKRSYFKYARASNNGKHRAVKRTNTKHAFAPY